MNMINQSETSDSTCSPKKPQKRRSRYEREKFFNKIGMPLVEEDKENEVKIVKMKTEESD